MRNPSPPLTGMILSSHKKSFRLIPQTTYHFFFFFFFLLTKKAVNIVYFFVCLKM